MAGAFLLLSVFITASLLVGCDNKPPATAPPAPSVTVARPVQKLITEWDEYTGRFAAVETVEVRARVSGFVDSIRFNEGQMVNRGDLLFIIDRRPYEIAVAQAKADVERAQAKLEVASLDVQRATPLVRSQSLTEREFDTRKAAERDAAGQVGSAEAALKQAELNLEWTAVRAPITGRISDRRVDAGNLITGGEHEALLVPDGAIASDQSRKIVFTIAADGSVGTKLVELGPIVDGLRVIRSGLATSDRIVIEGLQRARPGQKVTPEDGKIEIT